MLIIIPALVGVLLVAAVVEILVIMYWGTPVPAPSIRRDVQTLGKGSELTYVVMGDSTSIGQGAAYQDSYAEASAEHLGKTHHVHFMNVGISGATTKDVLNFQLVKAKTYKPDIVLLAVGANDARKFVGGSTIRSSLQKIIAELQTANPGVHIVLTGSPAMDSVPRFPWPANKLMGLRTRQVNKVVTRLIQNNRSLTFAPVAEKTRAAFLADPTLFAADKFHPNARGYNLWKPVINNALDRALNPVSSR